MWWRNSLIFLLAVVTLATAKPIMVTFGTHQGPIEPPEQTPKPAPRAAAAARSPAPVVEETEDVPNPHVYRPLVPHQYRRKIYAQRPPPSLILGTPIDQKYNPALEKFELYQKQQNRGVEYTGPHVFERQQYELEKRVPVRYVKPHFYQKEKVKTVPEIGVVYSAGVRYYVPQIVYVEPRQDEEQENSVYDHKDEKYFYKVKGQ
ncbi:uncharacterized protein GV1 isoform X2 [Tribolium castaneum]|uniref:uncharacterized protein GV1 isoform X2 n=1 Tax=Tribolium castaneum TaxID=7070 RepID=UPI0030FE408B